MENSILEITDSEPGRSGVAWPAIIAGAVTIAALSLILLAFGSGIGFASMSPWHNEGMSAKGLTVMAAFWLIIVQWLSSGLGGYLTGRLRCKWVNVHTHEVFFRDTAHGFLAWAVATIIGFGMLASATSHMIGAEHQSMNGPGKMPMAGEPPMGRANADPFAYYVDSLYRSDSPNAAANDQDLRAETERILMNGMKHDGVSEEDRLYLVQLVSARTGMSSADAEKRVADVMEKEKNDEIKVRQLADDARKATASLAIYAFLSMFIGAFIASVAAALGGRHRDEGFGIPKTIL